LCSRIASSPSFFTSHLAAQAGSAKEVNILVQLDRVEFKNLNVPHGHDPIDLSYRGFFLVCRLEIGLEMDLIGIKKGFSNDTEPLVFFIGSPTGA
jgi:hypothetical protein